MSDSFASPTRRTPSPADPGARWQAIREQWLARTPAKSPDLITDDDNNDGHKGNGQPACSSSPPTKERQKRTRDPVFQQRIATIEQLLREANALATGGGGNSSTAGTALSPVAVPARPPDRAAIIAKATAAASHAIAVGGGADAASPDGSAKKGLIPMPDEVEEEEEPDGGMPIRDHGAQGDPTHDLKKVSESIFLAFKQGRPLREPLPLALVTSLLFRSWYLDGTIPADYKPEEPTLPPPPTVPPAQLLAALSGGPSNASASSAAPMPIPRHVLAEDDALVSSPGTSPVSDGSSYLDRPTSGGSGAVATGQPQQLERRPSLLAALAERNSNAVTPLPSSDEGSPGLVPSASPAPILASSPAQGRQVPERETRPLARPVQVAAADSSNGPASRSPSLEGMGASSTSGKLQLDLLRGSRWRTEQEVASGSDVI